MRINQFLARHTHLSRRAADSAVSEGRVEINGTLAKLGDTVIDSDLVTLDSRAITTGVKTRTLILNKPVGYVCSRAGQGSKTVYDLLPAEYHHLNPIGRLDKDSSGLLLMTNDGELANQLTHPSFGKAKVYSVGLDRPLSEADKAKIRKGVDIGDERPSKFFVEARSEKTELSKLSSQFPILNSQAYQVRLSEGRNRQIRRTFGALGYKVTELNRTHFGPYDLGSLQQGKYDIITPDESR